MGDKKTWSWTRSATIRGEELDIQTAENVAPSGITVTADECTLVRTSSTSSVQRRRVPKTLHAPPVRGEGRIGRKTVATVANDEDFRDDEGRPRGVEAVMPTAL